MVSKLALSLLAVSAASILVEARVFHDSSAFSASRQLLQEADCPAGCDIAGGGCVRDSTLGGYRCIKCRSSLVVNNDDGTCWCPAGRYASAIDTCDDCPKGSYCAGGEYSAANSPDKVDCSTHHAGLTTLGKRSISKKACVNKPGYRYIAGTDPSAAQCPIDTYGPGLRKQRECVPCAPGFKSTAGSDAASDCVVPAGYFLKSPGQVAPCPKGEYKSGTATVAACTPCAAGVSTEDEASDGEDKCVLVLPSYYAFTYTDNIVKVTKKCPQKYWCPGGKPTAAFTPGAPNPGAATTFVIECTDQTWTVGLGASTVDECLTPPGYKTATGTTTKCDPGSYRAEWKPASAAASCDTCGANILSEETDQLAVYNIVTEAESVDTVATTSGACYILPGQGMYYSPESELFRAVNCETDNYGVKEKTTGLAAYPCRACPAGMETDAVNPPSNTYLEANGYTDPMACVTKVGFGYNGRVATQCRPDSYNAAGNYGTCTQCPTGFTTNGVAATQAVATDCRLAEGYGYENSVIGLCPVGKYRSGLGPDQASGDRLTEPCTACDNGYTTSRPGGITSDDCNLCLPGWGGTSDCTAQCTGATYGPAGRSSTVLGDSSPACLACPTMSVGFSFDDHGSNDPFTPAPVARTGAESAADCLAEFSQIEDVAWYLGGSATLTAVTGANNFTACAAACTDNCQYVTFDYEAADDAKCNKRDLQTSATDGNVLAFKAVLSGDVAAGSVTGKALASGSYTFWKDDGANVGHSTSGGVTTSTRACLAACDTDASCAAVKMTGVKADTTQAITGCTLLKGDTTVAQWKRTATRAVVGKLVVTAAAPLAP